MSAQSTQEEDEESDPVQTRRYRTNFGPPHLRETKYLCNTYISGRRAKLASKS